MKDLKKIADELVEKQRAYIEKVYADAIQYGEMELNNEDIIHSCIMGVNHTIETLEKVIQHDKLRYGITCRGASIELDGQLELKKILEGRL